MKNVFLDKKLYLHQKNHINLIIQNLIHYKKKLKLIMILLFCKLHLNKINFLIIIIKIKIKKKRILILKNLLHHKHL